MGWIAITYYTEGTGYAKEVRRLINSANALGIPLEVFAYQSLGNWRSNLGLKSACILRALESFQGLDIVFVDADAVFRSFPTVFDQLSEIREYDLAVHFFGRSMLEPGELLSGTLWISNSDVGRNIVHKWHEYAGLHHEKRHQKCLHIVLKELGPDIRVYGLPAGYTRIFDHPGMRGVEPVIEHFQASRKYRRNLNLPKTNWGQVTRLVQRSAE